MRFVTFRIAGTTRLGVVDGTRVIDVNRARAAMLRNAGVGWYAQARADAEIPPEALGFLAAGDAARTAVSRVLEWITDRSEDELRASDIVFRRENVRVHAPVPRPNRLFCVGVNFQSHAAERNREVLPYPILFSKPASAVIGPRDAVVIPRTTDQVDYEAELLVVIGRGGKYISRDEAPKHVAGYTCFNDISMRDYQYRTNQWFQGKCFDTSGPMGPELVGAEEISDLGALTISLTIDDETMQSSMLGNMIFDVPTMVSYLSEIVALEPGDCIAMGTPGGVGQARTPKRFLRPGETVRVEIEDIGVLENPVAAEAH